MARRKHSNEAAIIESVTGLAAIILFLWLFSPGFRSGVQVLLLVAAIVGLIALAVWLITKIIIKREQPSATFKTFTTVPHQTEKPIRKQPPMVFVEPLKYVPSVPKPNISENLRKIDWFQFEKLIELIYQHRGFSVERLGGANPDGGVDLIAKSSSEHFALQCKHWRKSRVGVKDIREFLGALKDSNIQNGVFITLVGYSSEAKQLADRQGIQILNELDLVKMLKDTDLMYSKEISALFADERKFCPKCESEMVMRANRQTGDKFWGCSTFPRCWAKLPFEA